MTEKNSINSKLRVLNTLPENPQPEFGRFPPWLHLKIPKGNQIFQTQAIVDKYQLNTVCEEAKCPNRLHCYSHQTATFLALGKECMRSCSFCDIDFSRKPKGPESDEPFRIAASVYELGLKHVVITMVARDDLQDGGASHIAAIIRETRMKNPHCTIEVLTSDFEGNLEALDKVLAQNPEVFNHNIETVKILTPKIRHKATYDRTLNVLQYAKNSHKTNLVKSGLMVGLGETESQVFETLTDLKDAGCDIVTIGQYLQPSRRKIILKAFITPQQFKIYEEFGYKLGIRQMYCGPFVRSSFNAHEVAILTNTK